TGKAQGSGRVLIPSVTNVGGFVSTLTIVNTGSEVASVDIISRGSEGRVEGQITNIFIPPKGYYSTPDILATLEEGPGVSSLEIISADGQPLIAASGVSSVTGTSAFFVGQDLR